jgi:cyanuric acid amidohydrolase
MGLSRGASALGVALALGEVARDALSDAAIGSDTSLYSGRASTSAGVELMRNEIILLGMSRDWAGDLVIAHDVMADAIDLPAVQRALGGAGLNAGGGQLSAADQARRHARALVGGVIAAATGRTALFVSGGAEHQGPDGGGPVAVIARQALR